MQVKVLKSDAVTSSYSLHQIISKPASYAIKFIIFTNQPCFVEDCGVHLLTVELSSPNYPL